MIVAATIYVKIYFINVIISATNLKSSFSNSLIIHRVKTKKIVSVKEVWIPGLN